MLKTKIVDYQENTTTLEGYYAYDEKTVGKRPAVIVAHDWTGKNDFARNKAEKLAELGYVGFALDMYGNGITGKTKEEKSALIKPLMEDRKLLQKRVTAALDAVRNLAEVDPSRIAIIGFCFGGLCALDLARSGADIKGAVSFHGLFYAPDFASKPIKAKILALHGHDDPMATPAQALEFMKEMTEAKANWELDMYGNTMHGFTNPEANDPAFGTVYSKEADTRAWARMVAFFGEIFG